MALAVGARRGPYEITATIGAGGMGEVYRARDTKLERDVALKILPEAFARDPERLARFEREAKTLAALNHPHIAHIHGLEESDGVPTLVLEFVDGPTLADRIAQGPIPIEEALTIARQIAEAVEAAHEQGIIHRDLKPANIKVRIDGTVKVLDFGLAKALDPTSAGAADVSASPTITAAAPMTAAGVLLGTAAYMSPEQARGQAVDKRTDIWAFGCVLFEMLTGRSPFERSTATDTSAAVLEHDPDWPAIPANTPPGVVRILRRCLEKDPRRRLRDLGDWDLAIEPDVIGRSGRTGPPSRNWLQWLPWAALAGCVGVGGLFLANRTAPSPAAPAPPTRFDIPAGVSLSESGQFSISPDGRHLVFAGIGDDRMIRLWIRSFDAPEVRPLIGTEAEVAQVIPPMFWSPDSQFIAFYADGKIMKVSRLGGTVPEVVCQVPRTAVGGSWNGRGDIKIGRASCRERG